MNRLATIHLHGPLADKYGDEHRLAVSTPIEAVRALQANHPGFLADFAKYEAFGLYADGDWRGGDKAGTMPFARELHICPVIEGRAFVGAALVTAVTGLTGITATIIGGVLMAGVLFGLSYLLTPKINRDENEGRDENYAFTGPENVTGQGVAVPLIYGRVHAGSVVISAGLDLGTDLAATVPEEAPPPVGGPSTAVEPGLLPPPGGWPPIVYDRFGNPYPKGWVWVSSDRSISDLFTPAGFLGQAYSKTVAVYQGPGFFHAGVPFYTPRKYWLWNRNRGFYSSTQGQWPREDDYQPGGHR